jgi:hypothetical protein
MRTRLSFVLLAAVLLTVLASSQAMALCYAECPSGSYCTGIPVCCCVDDLWPYFGPIAGNPCGVRLASANSEQNTSLDASYAAIFAPAAQPSAASK